MILGVDLGQKTTGLATSDSVLATPYGTIKHSTQKEAVKKIAKITEELNTQTVVIGFVEGKIKTLFEDFAKQLKEEKPELEIILWDETLTSRQATDNMIKLGIAQKKRREKEHQEAAAFILQSYLDYHD